MAGTAENAWVRMILIRRGGHENHLQRRRARLA